MAYALAGTMDWDPAAEPLGTDKDGADVFLADVWPSDEEIASTIASADLHGDVTPPTTPTSSPATSAGRTLPTPDGDTFTWDEGSTYVRKPPFFDGIARAARPREPTSPAHGCWPSSATR